MKVRDINNQYIDLIKSDKNKYFKDYVKTLDLVAKSEAQYKGKPVPFLYHPMFFTEKDIDNMKKIGNMMISISNKVTERYLNNKEFRKKFNYPKEMEELILIDNVYDINVPIGRFDIFYRDYDNFKFCELNTDGSSAMNEDNTIARILLDRKGPRDFKYELEYFELIDSWVKESLEIYKSYNKTIEKPNVAIVDFKESATGEEFELFKKSYERAGCKSIIVDPRDLEYRNKTLYYEDFKIDMVYRRMVTFELVEKIDEIPDFIQAYKDQSVCVIGSIRSQIVHNKIIFKILHDKDTLEFLNIEEREFVKKHIPLTFEFKDDKKLFNEVSKNKDKYIMKPLDLNASRGVFAGRDMNQTSWEERLGEIFNSDYIAQEFVTPYERDFIVFKDGDLKIERFGSIVGIFMYNEKFRGLYTRIGQESIIAGLTSYYTVPNVIVR